MAPPSDYAFPNLAPFYESPPTLYGFCMPPPSPLLFAYCILITIRIGSLKMLSSLRLRRNPLLLLFRNSMNGDVVGMRDWQCGLFGCQCFHPCIWKIMHLSVIRSAKCSILSSEFWFRMFRKKRNWTSFET